jgi:hypothetical protein
MAAGPAAKVDLSGLPADLCDSAPAEAPGLPDPDARFGRKSATKSFYGYKEHLATDADSELITAVAVMPAKSPTVIFMSPWWVAMLAR